MFNSPLPELDETDLAFHRFGIVEDVKTVRLYLARRGELVDLEYTPAIAYYVDEAGTPRLLEEPPGPQSRQAADEQEAAREEARNAPRPRPSWMTP